MAQFYLCSNPAEDMPAGIVDYIYSYTKPRFFAVFKKLNEGLPLAEIAYSGVTAMFYYQAPGELDPSYYLIYVSDNIDKVSYAHEQVIGVLHEAVGWYVSLHSAGKTLTAEEFGFAKDYSAELEHVQIYEDGATGECLLNFALGAKAFTSFEATQAFMHKELGIAKDIVYCDLPAVNMD